MVAQSAGFLTLGSTGGAVGYCSVLDRSSGKLKLELQRQAEAWPPTATKWGHSAAASGPVSCCGSAFASGLAAPRQEGRLRRALG